MDPPRLRALASFLPRTLIRILADDVDRPRPEARTDCQAAVLFADLSGFTPLAESLDRSGPDGAERLTALLDACFAQLIETVHSHGGDILRLAGDALIALWSPEVLDDLPQAVRLAAQCAQALQAAVQVRELNGVRLRLRVGIGAGLVRLMDLGGENGRWEFLAAGPPLLQMGQAEHAASPDEVGVSEEAWRLLGELAEGERVAGGAWRLTRLVPLPLPNVQPPEPPPGLEAALRAYIPEMVLHRLDAGHSHWLAEFRNASVLFINLGDAAFAAGERPEELQVAFRTLQEVLRRFEGNAPQLVVDDKGVVVVAAFGLPPLAHEDDAVRAVHVARELHATLGALRVPHRIGITSGRIFCGPCGSADRREYVMVGHTVNLAARLMQEAEEQVLCDAATARLAASRLDFESLGPMRPKGTAQPVEVFRPRASVAARAQSAAVRLVGRAVERERLVGALRALREEERSGVLLVEGEAGIGKTQVVGHVLELAGAAGLSTALGAGDPVGQSSAYHAWRALLGQLLGLEALPDAAARTQRLLEHLAARPERLPWAPLLNAVLPVEVPDNESVRGMTGTLRGANTRELVVQLLQDAAEARPLVLALDDVHWMDSSSWELALAAQRRVRRLLLVLACRPMGERTPAEYQALREKAGAGYLVLDRLRPRDALELVRQRLGVRALPAPVEELISGRAEGHPFFSEELACALRDAGHLLIEGGECRLSPTAGDLRALNLPGTVHGIVTSRLDRLTPQQQLTVKVASVIGRVFAYRELEEVHPVAMDRAGLPEQLEALEHLDITPLETPEPNRTYAFKHALIQETAYNLMAFAQRRQLHRAVALFHERFLQEDTAREEKSAARLPLLAHHWRMAEEPAKALEYLEKAGEAAYTRGANHEAIDFLTQARRLAAGGAPGVRVDPERRAHWSARLGEAYFGLGQLRESRAALEEGLRQLGRPLPSTSPGWVLRLCGEALRQLWHLALRGRSSHTAPERRRLALTSRITATVAEQCYVSLDRLAFLVASLSSINDAEAARLPALAARPYASLGFLVGVGRLPGLATLYFRRARRSREASISARADTAEGFYHVAFGRFEEALRLLARAMAVTRPLNDLLNVGFEMAIVCISHECSGGPASALPHLDSMLKTTREASNVHQGAWALLGIAGALLSLDRPEEARARLREAEALIQPSEQLTLLLPGRAAAVYLRLDDVQAAGRELERMRRMLRSTPLDALTELSAFTAFAETALSLWERTQPAGRDEAAPWAATAAEACRAMRKLARLFPVVRSRAERLEGVRAHLAGKPRRAARLLGCAVATAHAFGLQHDEALALYQLGRAACGPDRAEPLRRAGELFDRLGDLYHLRITRALRVAPKIGQASPTEAG